MHVHVRGPFANGPLLIDAGMTTVLVLPGYTRRLSLPVQKPRVIVGRSSYNEKMAVAVSLSVVARSH